VPHFSQRDTPSRSSPGVPGKRYEVISSAESKSKGGRFNLACRLANSCVSSGDDDNLPGQIWDVLHRELWFRSEIGSEGRSVDESGADIESGGVSTHLGSSSGSE